MLLEKVVDTFQQEHPNSPELSEMQVRLNFIETMHDTVGTPAQACQPGPSSGRRKRNVGMSCKDSRNEEEITEEGKQRIQELLDDETITKIKLKGLESAILDQYKNTRDTIVPRVFC